jgi:thiamine pyrophosphate-dependent acetolactate synthase large subunit-like protein
MMPSDGAMFLTLMGGPTPFAFGVATALPHRRVLALDTDGSTLMNPGALCTLGNERPPNLTVLVFDNEVYEGAALHPTHTGRNVDLERIAAGAGIPCTATARDLDSVTQWASKMLDDGQVGFLLVKVEPGIATFPPEQRKITDGIEDKYRFIRHVERLENISIKPPFVAD